ncbi:hypothetical protein [Bacillus subtilis]|uniref:Uncharacterized protein n=1 Tax=Bacillus phage PM1 TaxID=547228 RepID=M4ZS01_9CAUD|nr:hypothetical protein [Bacillus subtilis]YP_007678069.1 hypothetical protein K203_gp43 [Bacillus phage PM1]BAM99123.1 hypothetical protein [Bacillus phage PM1]
MKIKNFRIHRKTQFDLGMKDIKPLVCIHKTYDGGCGSKRILLLAFDGWKPVFEFSNPFKYKY